VSNWQAIIFDLDDTLYPEREYVISGFRAVAVYLSHLYDLDINTIHHRLCDHFEAGVRGNTYNLLLHEIGIPTDSKLIQRLVSIYRVHEPTIELYQDVDTILSVLRKTFCLGLLTDGYAVGQRRKVKSLELQDKFDAIVYSDDLGRENWKPSIVPFQTILQQLCLQPEKAIYIGDNPLKDFIGARKLGMGTVRLRRSRGEHENIIPSVGFEADYEIATLDELLPLL
jgi:putative hydrolase of the HAD superfamily